MKNDKTKRIIWATVALVIGVIIGLIITNVTTGDAKAIAKQNVALDTKYNQLVERNEAFSEFLLSLDPEEFGALKDCTDKTTTEINADCFKNKLISELGRSEEDASIKYINFGKFGCRPCGKLCITCVACCPGWLDAY